MPARTTTRTSDRDLASTAGEIAQRTRGQMTDRFDSGKVAFTRQILGVAGALRTTAEHLDENDQGAFARYAHGAADVAERFGDSIERKDLSELMADLERTCRERPLVVGAAALALGFLGARFLRSRREEEMNESIAQGTRVRVTGAEESE